MENRVMIGNTGTIIIAQLQQDLAEAFRYNWNPCMISDLYDKLHQAQTNQLQRIARQQQIAQNNFYISPLAQQQGKPGDIIPFKKYPGDTRIREEDIIFRKLLKMTYEDMLNGAMEEL